MTHPASVHVLQFFEHEHLPPHLAAVSRPFHGLAHALVDEHQLDGPELTVALRKLLEAKDAAVRARIARWANEIDAAAARVTEALSSSVPMRTPPLRRVFVVSTSRSRSELIGRSHAAQRGRPRAPIVHLSEPQDVYGRSFDEYDLILWAGDDSTRVLREVERAMLKSDPDHLPEVVGWRPEGGLAITRAADSAATRGPGAEKNAAENGESGLPGAPDAG